MHIHVYVCQSAVSVISMKEERRSGQKQLEDAKQKLEENGSQIDTMLEGDDSGERLQLAQRTK